MQIRKLLLAALVVAVSAAGCSRGDGAVAPASTRPQATSAAAPSTTASLVPRSSGVPVAPPATTVADDLAAFCADVDPILRFDDTAVPGRPYLDAASQAAVARLATSAPAEMRPHVEVWRRAFEEAKDLVVGDAADRRTFIASMADPEFTQATRAISEFDRQHCRK